MQYMQECQLDAMIASSAINVGYFSGYFCWLNSLLKEYMSRPGASSHLPETYAVLTRDGDVALIVSSIFAPDATRIPEIHVQIFGPSGLDFTESPKSCAEEQTLWNLLAQPQDSVSPLQALLAILRGHGLTNGRIGIEMDGMPLERIKAIADGLPPASLKDCSNLVRLIRAVKSAQELQRLTQAAEITERAGMRALELAKPGVAVHEIVQQFHAHAAAMGAAFDHFAYSPRGLGIAMNSNYQFASDDVMFVDFGCRFNQYFSDTGVTLAMGDLPTTLERRYTALRACIAAGTSEMRPGVRASKVQKVMADEFAAHGFGACFPHGHGLGLEVRDYPILVPDSNLRLVDDCLNVSADLPLEEGMVNNLEACVFLPGIGSVHLEKSFVLTAHGNRELARQDRNQPYSPVAGTRLEGGPNGNHPMIG
jgi:Xaa-Pro dipeptidase